MADGGCRDGFGDGDTVRDKFKVRIGQHPRKMASLFEAELTVPTTRETEVD